MKTDAATQRSQGGIEMRSFGSLMRVVLSIGMINTTTAVYARDGSAYVGIEVGPVVRWNTQDVALTSTFTQSPFVVPPGDTAYLGRLDPSLLRAPTTIISHAHVGYEPGFDVDALGGYDFGHY